MKKVAVAIVLALALVCLCCCTLGGDVFSQLNAAQKAEYASLAVNVTSTKGDVELTGLFNITFKDGIATVNYSFDKLNELQLDGDNPEEYKTRVIGTATVTDGKVDDEIIQDVALDYSAFRFDKANLANISATGATLKADVVDPKAFVGNSDFAGTDMKLEVVVSNGAFTKIALSYASDGYAVQTVYMFTTH